MGVQVSLPLLWKHYGGDGNTGRILKKFVSEDIGSLTHQHVGERVVVKITGNFTRLVNVLSANVNETFDDVEHNNGRTRSSMRTYESIFACTMTSCNGVGGSCVSADWQHIPTSAVRVESSDSQQKN